MSAYIYIYVYIYIYIYGLLCLCVSIGGQIVFCLFICFWFVCFAGWLVLFGVFIQHVACHLLAGRHIPLVEHVVKHMVPVHLFGNDVKQWSEHATQTMLPNIVNQQTSCKHHMLYNIKQNKLLNYLNVFMLHIHVANTIGFKHFRLQCYWTHWFQQHYFLNCCNTNGFGNSVRGQRRRRRRKFGRRRR